MVGVIHLPRMLALREQGVTEPLQALVEPAVFVPETLSGMAILEQDPVHKLTDAIDALSSEKRKDLATMLETLYARLVKPT